jgi:hypothetical protein
VDLIEKYTKGKRPGGARHRRKAAEEDNQNTYGFVDGVWEYRHAGQIIPIADLSLDMMAIGIKSHRESAERCFSHGVEHAFGAGELLIAAKKKIKHGEWLPWLETHCELALRTAQAYMRLARLPVEKRNGVAHLPLRDALSAISSRAERNAEAERREQEPPGRATFAYTTPEGLTLFGREAVNAIPVPPSRPPPSEDEIADDLIEQLAEAVAAAPVVSIEALRAAFDRRFPPSTLDDRDVQ